MKLKFFILLLAQVAMSGLVYAQDYLRIGSTAPEIKIGKWLKGEEISSFKHDNIYIVEFWATWCTPCIANIPHLTEIAKKYKDKNVHVIGVDASDGNMSADSLQSFVDRRADKMEYSVAIDNKDKFMGLNWLKLAGSSGIPKSFIVDQKGNIAWIGHPALLEPMLVKVLAGDVNYQEIDRTIKRDAPKPKWTLQPESPKITQHVVKMRKLIAQKKFEEAFLIYDDLRKKDSYTASGLTTQALEALLNTDFRKALFFYKQLIKNDAPQLLWTVHYVTRLKENLPREFYKLSKAKLLKCLKQQPFIRWQPYYNYALAEVYVHLDEPSKAVKIINNDILRQLMTGTVSSGLEYSERKLKRFKEVEIRNVTTRRYENIFVSKRLSSNATVDDKLDAILTPRKVNSELLLDSLKSRIPKINFYDAYKFTFLLNRDEKIAADFGKDVLTKQNNALNPREILLMSVAVRNKLGAGVLQSSISKLGLELCDQGLKKLEKPYFFFFYDLQSEIYANDGKYQQAMESKQKMLDCLEQNDYSEVITIGTSFFESYKKECRTLIDVYRKKISSTK